MIAALVRGVAIGSLYSLLAIGLAVLHKGTRSISFAHGELGGIAALVAASLVADGWAWSTAAIVAVGAAVAVGVVFGVAARRTADDALTLPIATSALLLLLVSVEIKAWGVAPRTLPQPFDAIGPSIAGYHVAPSLLLGIGLCVLAVVVFALIDRTAAGSTLAAVAQDPDLAAVRGIDVATTRIVTWAASTAISAIAALLLVASLGAFAPGSVTTFFLRALAAMLIGGRGSIAGAAVGGVVVGIVEQLAEHALLGVGIPGLKTLAVLALILIVLGLRPGGLRGVPA